MNRSAAALWLFVAYGVFVVYGSLVPLEFRAMPLDVAWERFQHIPFLKLGIESRADWVANGVLYAPLAFLAARALSDRGLAHGTAALLASVVCSALGVFVEFTQLYFPLRTVSQNDILAECIGSVLGAVSAPVAARWLDRLALAWRGGGSRLLPRLLELYAAAYVLLCFFPYDLLLSSAEIQNKWRVGHWGWWLASHDRGALFAAVQWLVEVAMAVPLGALPLFHRNDAGRSTPRPALALLLGGLIGVAIELGQFFVASGVSQGASVLSRALGVWVGAVGLRAVRSAGWSGVRAALRPWVVPLWLLYLPLLAALNGAFRLAWHGPAQAWTSWQGTRLLPFYYHYFTSEALALFSLGSVALMYLPVAALVWIRGGSVTGAACAAAGLALLIEFGKLFLETTHADPTNIGVAAAACGGALLLLNLAQRQPQASGDVPAPLSRRSRPAAALLFALPVAWGWALSYPVLSWTLLGLLLGVAAAIWRWPVLALALIPAALPVFDLAPWSGRFFWDEFDLLQLVCLAIAIHRTPPAAAAVRPLTAIFALLGLSLALSTLRGWLLAPGLDDSLFSSYYSAFNGLRILKGAVWAWLFVMVWRRLAAHGAQRARFFSAGMAAGLALTVLFMLWERAVFAGLFDFSADFRATGPFSAMHKGGAYVECYLAVASAFVVAWVLRVGPLVQRGGALVLLAGAGYAVFVTYSRNGYAALGMVVLASLLGMLPAFRGARADARPRNWTPVGHAAGLLLLLAAVALPIAGGSYACQRLAASGQDFATRTAHWKDGLALRDPGLSTSALGMGVGRFPERHFWGSRETRHAASYRLMHDGDSHFLRLAQGARLYIEQIVPRPELAALRLSLDWRGRPGQAVPEVALCEKWTLTSLNCARAAVLPTLPVSAPAATGAAATAPWQHAEIQLDASWLLAAGRAFRAPLKLAVVTPAEGSFDITRLRLTTALGDELLSNGDFSQGMDRWFFATDVDPPWHLHSLPVSVLFDQGWLGVLAWTASGLTVLLAGGLLLWRGQAQVPAALPALLGFAVSATLNTLIDAPRFLWLLLVLLWLAAAPVPTAPPVPAGVSQRRGR